LEREAPAYEAKEPVEDWEPRKYVISTADILRERAPALLQHAANGAVSGEIAGLEKYPEATAASSTFAQAPVAAEEFASAETPRQVETPMAVAAEREVTLADILREPPTMPAEPQVAVPVEAVVPAAAVEPHVAAAMEAPVPAATVAEPVELAVNPIPEAVVAVVPVEARAEQVDPAPPVQSVAAEAISENPGEPLRVAAVEPLAEAPVAQVQAAGEIMPNPEPKKEEAPASTALVAEPKSNVIAMGAEQGANRPRGKRMTRAKRDQVVTIADICRDWVLEEMLEKTGGAGEIDGEEDLQEELEDLIEGISAEPAESVFAHEGIWGNPGRLEGAGQDEGAVSEQAEQTTGLVASEGLTEMEGSQPGVQGSGVKALLRLGSLLPWLARDFPVVESEKKQQSTALTQEVRDEVAGMRLVQHEIRSTVHDHSLQLKRVEEQLSRVRETLVEEASETADLVDTVKTTNRAVAMFGVGVCLLLVVMLAMLVVLVMHGR
jgi:hypothetical protein